MTAETSADASCAVVARSSDRAAAEFCRWLSGTLLGLLLFTALLVGWRRLARALSTPLGPAALSAVGGVAAAAALGARLLWRARRPQAAAAEQGWSTWILPSLALALLAAALSLPSTSSAGLLALWTPLAAEELLAWGSVAWRAIRSRRRRSAEDRRRRPKTLPEESRADLPSTQPAGNPGPSPKPPLTVETLPGDVLQQLTRSRAEDGSEQVGGYVRTRFDPGQRTASVHVAFCPPFARTPKLTVRQMDGPAARVKTVQLVPYGTRLDLKLAAASGQSEGVTLEFLARLERE
jgi:hypothetical protein